MPGMRRKARVVALQCLFETDCVGHDAQEALARLIAEASFPEEGASFSRELVQGVLAGRDRLDATIRRFAPQWPLEQLPVVDRNILRIAIFELLSDGKTPPKAAINEAVELAKTFGGENSPRFVNGVLGSVMNTLRTAGERR